MPSPINFRSTTGVRPNTRCIGLYPRRLLTLDFAQAASWTRTPHASRLIGYANSLDLDYMSLDMPPARPVRPRSHGASALATSSRIPARSA